MTIIFSLLFLVTFSYLVIVPRRVDLFSLSIVSFYIYHIPYFAGTFELAGLSLNPTDISNEAYAYIMAIGLSLLGAMILFDRRNKGHSNLSKRYCSFSSDGRFQAFFITAVAVVLLLISISVGGLQSVLNFKDNGGNGAWTVFYGLSVWGGLVGLSLGLFHNIRAAQVICFCILTFGLLVIGSRSYFVTALLVVIVFFVSGQGRVVLAKHFRWGLGFAFALAFILTYKIVYQSIQNLDFSGVYAALADAGTYATAFAFREPYIVSSHFQQALESNLFLGADFLVHRILSIIPFMSGIFEGIVGKDFVRYSHIIMNRYYPDLWYGLASNVWAEAYAIGRLPVFVSFLALWVGGIYYLNTGLLRRRAGIYPYLFPFAIYIAFYVHRIDMTFIFGSLKTCIAFFCFAVLAQILLTGRTRIRM